jgi:RNA polymerase sigma-70 factor (ECF subfamily)
MRAETPPKRKKVKDRDYELIRAINSGQAGKFRELVERYAHKLYNFNLRMCRDPADAEDLVQETFLAVFRYIKDFRHETKFKNWLYRVAASACIKKLRKSRFAPEREISLEEFDPSAEAETIARVPEWAQQPLEQMLNEELLGTLNEAILSLPEKYRIVVVLRDIEGFSTEEAAQILNLSVTNVKVRLHRARLFLREKLKGYYDHGV